MFATVTNLWHKKTACSPRHTSELHRVAFTYPAIDSHAHALLRAECRDYLRFEGSVSPAEGDALTEDALQTVPCFRAIRQLAELLGLSAGASWEEIKAKRSQLDYLALCNLTLGDMATQCILVDENPSMTGKVYDAPWHDQFTSSPSRRIVRIEAVAERILGKLFQDSPQVDNVRVHLDAFVGTLTDTLVASASHSEVAAFKSVICYRTGLAIAAEKPCIADGTLDEPLRLLLQGYKTEGRVRLRQKPINDLVVHIALGIGAKFRKPVQFHTGLGDNDLTLTLSSPAHLQPLIRAYPKSTFVLLHTSYPYTQDAGYLTAVYSNVFLDLGEVFPLVSGQGQRSIIRQVLELCPTNKVMWSTDAHFWPECYYLANIQSRSALYDVLLEHVKARELTQNEAITLLKNVFFHTANRVYNLGLKPKPKLNLPQKKGGKAFLKRLEDSAP